MSRHGRRPHMLVSAVGAGLLALALVSIQLGAPPDADAQTSGTASQVPISLSNRSAGNYHLWIGHTAPSTQRAWVVPGGVSLWYVDFKAGGRNVNNVIYIDDKIVVNAMRQGDWAPYSSLVQSSFSIRGFAKNIRILWDGARWQLLVDYEDDAGQPLAGGDGQASPSGAVTSGGAIEDGAADIAGMDPADLTRALNTAIIAIIIGILAGGLGASGAETVTAPAGGQAPATGPADSGLRDPDSGEPVAEWEPGKYVGGAPGDVWYDGRWQPAAAAAAQIQATLDRKAAQDAYNRQWDQDYRDRNAQLEAEAQARQRAADAAARAEREAQQRAIATMAGIRTAAMQRGDSEMYRRATTGMTYGPDGKLDTDLVKRMRDTMVDRIARDKGPEEPSSHWVTEGFKSTFDDARHNPLIRAGAAVLTGGSSEVGYLGQSAYDAMKAAAEKALKENRGFGYADALRAGSTAVGKERLPVSTIELLATKGRQATLKELTGSVITDAMAAQGIRDGVKQLGATIQAARTGPGGMKTLTARPPAAPAAPGGPPKGLRDLPEGSPVVPGQAGISKAAARHQQWVSDVRGVEIKTRPVGDDVLRRIQQGDMPKPSTIKAKTISRDDVLLGAPAEHAGRVGYFEPKMPRTTGMSPEQIIDLQKRFIQRRDEFKSLAHDMQQLQKSGKVTIEGGVVKSSNGKYITGDYDVYSIKMKDGSPAPDWLKEQVMKDLKKPPFNAQHDAHVDWKFDPNDPLHGKANVTIDRTIRDSHAPPAPVDPNVSIIEGRMGNPGGTPLITTSTGGASPRTTFDHAGVVR